MSCKQCLCKSNVTYVFTNPRCFASHKSFFIHFIHHSEVYIFSVDQKYKIIFNIVHVSYIETCTELLRDYTIILQLEYSQDGFLLVTTVIPGVFRYYTLMISVQYTSGDPNRCSSSVARRVGQARHQRRNQSCHQIHKQQVKSL